MNIEWRIFGAIITENCRQITENLPDISSGPFLIGPHLLMPGMSPFMVPLTGTPAFAIPGGDFTITMDTLSASDAAGLALTYSGVGD